MSNWKLTLVTKDWDALTHKTREIVVVVPDNVLVLGTDADSRNHEYRHPTNVTNVLTYRRINVPGTHGGLETNMCRVMNVEPTVELPTPPIGSDATLEQYESTWICVSHPLDATRIAVIVIG